jgi:hypothetical protein
MKHSPAFLLSQDRLELQLAALPSTMSGRKAVLPPPTTGGKSASRPVDGPPATSFKTPPTKARKTDALVASVSDEFVAAAESLIKDTLGKLRPSGKAMAAGAAAVKASTRADSQRTSSGADALKKRKDASLCVAGEAHARTHVVVLTRVHRSHIPPPPRRGSETKKTDTAVKEVNLAIERELAALDEEVEKESTAIDRTIATTLAGLKAARE